MYQSLMGATQGGVTYSDRVTLKTRFKSSGSLKVLLISTLEKSHQLHLFQNGIMLKESLTAGLEQQSKEMCVSFCIHSINYTDETSRVLLASSLPSVVCNC